MTVLPGIDVLLTQQITLIQDRRIGLISSAGGVTQNLTPTLEALQNTPGVTLTALLGPEHGFYGAEPDGLEIASSTDLRTTLPVYSLYGDTVEPTAAMLEQVDVLLFDIQSAGVRFYTYIATLYHVMRAAATHQVPVIVCDRPNPIGGEKVEGPILKPGFESFIGPGPLPIRYGMTFGELAQLYRDVWGIACDLTVVPCQGWSRNMIFAQTGLVWVPTSPAMPKPDTTIVYPGLCLIEGTNLSEGRGTATPFEVIGAPWIKDWVLAKAMNDLNLPGVRFRPTQFLPTDSKWQGYPCYGIQTHVTDPAIFAPVTVGLQIVATLKRLYPANFAWREAHFDRLLGTDEVRLAIDAGVAVDEIVAGWQTALNQFEAERQTVLIY